MCIAKVVVLYKKCYIYNLYQQPRMKIEQNVCRLCTKAFKNQKSKCIDDNIRAKIQELLRIKVPFGFK